MQLADSTQQDQAPDPAALLHLLCACHQLQPAGEVAALLRAAAGGRLSRAAQRLLLTRCLAAPLRSIFPCDADYLRRLLKVLVLAVEADGEEVLDELMELCTACLVGQDWSGLLAPTRVPPLPAPPAGWCYKLFAYAAVGQPPAATLARLQQMEASLVAATPGADTAAEGAQQRAQQQEVPGGADAGSPVHGERAGSSGAGADAEPQVAATGADGSLIPPLVCPAVDSSSGTGGGSGACGAMALRVSRNLFEGGTGCHEWEAGFFLAEVVLSHPALFAGRSCLELGSGCGMVGVALHRAGAARAVCTDGDSQSVYNCRCNLQLNGVPLRGPAVRQAACGRLCLRAAEPAGAGAGPGSGGGAGAAAEGGSAPSWHHGTVAEARELRWEVGTGELAPDMVLAADVLYDPQVIPDLLAIIKQLLWAGTAAAGGGAGGQPQPLALVATTRRQAATLALFVDTATADEELGLEDVTSSLVAGGIGGGEGAVRFLHHPALEAARDRIVLHKLTLVAGGDRVA